jgi:class 3 adenylate cyclase/tetratricopeptide (TPR) repeat protein
VICPTCSTENILGAKFCNECGTPLAAACPNCGAVNKPGAKFCNECGTPFVGSSAAVPPAHVDAAAGQPVAERRLVTVLFADIVGFTPFAEERDAEDVRETLSRYFELCAQIVQRYGGIVEKYIGDAVMAVWGAPTAHEDDVERAVRAALELVDAVSALGPDIQARAGVLTGEAAVTLGATNQGMVAGDIVNTAARLQSVAAAGTVLVGESTYRAAAGAVAFEEAGEQVLKGKQAPVPAWRAIRVVAEVGGRKRSEGLEAPFVGRADELRLLKDLFHATGREQKARLVSVIGPAGIGKSRLAWEFLKYVDGLVETTYWHNGRSPAYGEGISFWALGEMIRSRAGLMEIDDEETTRRKIAATVAEWVTNDEERAWIERSLLALLGVESGLSPDALFAAWRTFFERISERGTVTLVFEDMHFADTGLLDFIDHLLEWSRGRPIYIVTLARPDLLERRANWGAAKRSFTSIYLEPLSEADMRDLLAGLVPGIPDGAASAIVARADGIPLYAVETVRTLVADGKLVERDGAYAPVGDLTNLAVPETLTALIRSRLDALDVVDRDLVHDAAVIGQSFSIEALAAVSSTDAADLEPRLRALVRRELIQQEVDPRSPERGQYIFVQALIREVAYNTLAKRDRKTRHIAAARYFEALGSDELAGGLAGHYLAAHANAGEPAEADALAAQARVALKAAADRAAALGSFELAARFFEQALSISSEPADIALLHERAGEACVYAAAFDAAINHLETATKLRRELGDRVVVARTITLLGLALSEARRNQAAIELIEPADIEFADILEGEAAASMKWILSRSLNQVNRNAEARAAADDGLEVAEHLGLIKQTALLMVSKGAALGFDGRLREGLALLAGAVELCRENGWDEVLSGALTVSSALAGEVSPRRAWESAAEAAEIARRTGHLDRLFIAAGNAAYSGFTIGEWESSLAVVDPLAADPEIEPGQRIYVLSNAIIIHASRGDDVSAAIAAMDELTTGAAESELVNAARDARANLAMATGDLENASVIWREMKISEPQLGPWACYQAARPALWLGKVDDVKADMNVVEQGGLHGPVVDARLVTLRAGVAAREGRPSEAMTLYADALGAWRALGQVWDEALTGLDAVTLLDPGLPQVAAIGQSTRQILERLGARPYLERLDRVLTSKAATPATSDGSVQTEIGTTAT